jgi:carboxymethylenebutenolidase
VHVLEVVAKPRCRQGLADARKAFDDRVAIRGRDQPARREHVRVRDRARDVVREYAVIEVHRGVEPSGIGIEGTIETAPSRAFRSRHAPQYKAAMTQRVTFPTSGGEAAGVAARPPAVVVLQEYWGINKNIQDVVTRWSREGFVAIAPDLYHGKLAANADEAMKLMQALDWGKAMVEIAGAVDWARAHGNGKVAITGYCMGGALTFAAATHLKGLAAAVPFYGVPPQADWSKVDAPVQAHFAQTDEWATVAKGKEIQAAIKGMELHTYDAQHAFCNADRPEVYNASCASQAWSRAVAFVRQHTT